MITFGLVVGFFVCYSTANLGSSISWRLPFILLSGFSFTFSTAALWLTHSPRWLTLRGRTAEAAAAWDALGVSHAEREKVEIEEHIREVTDHQEQGSTVELFELPNANTNSASQRNAKKSSFAELFSREMRARTFLASFMMAMQQLSGIDGVLYVSWSWHIQSFPYIQKTCITFEY